MSHLNSLLGNFYFCITEASGVTAVFVVKQVFDSVNATYSDFKSNFTKRLSAEVPVASSPITTRWRQSQTRALSSDSFGEEQSTTYLPEASGSVLKTTPEKETLTLGEEPQMPQPSYAT